MDVESGRRDRWRDEERDTNSNKDRWTEHSGNKMYGREQRWTDTTNKDPNRESKWNTRWGPDDKDTEGLRDKWIDSGKEANPNVSKVGKDEKEGEAFRPWRGSSAQGRGNQTPSNKPYPPYNRGTPYSFSVGRGRGGTHPPALGTFSDKDSHELRYTRIKLLDVYKSADMRTQGDGFLEVPSLTVNQPVEPFALCQPNSEELVLCIY